MDNMPSWLTSLSLFMRSQVTLLTRPHTDGTEKEYKLLRQKLSVNPVQYQLCGKPLPMPKSSRPAGAQPAGPASTLAASSEAAPAADGSAPLAALPVESKEGPDAGTNPVNTGYIKVATFSKQTAEAVKAAIKALQAQGATRYCASSQPAHPLLIPPDLVCPPSACSKPCFGFCCSCRPDAFTYTKRLAGAAWLRHETGSQAGLGADDFLAAC